MTNATAIGFFSHFEDAPARPDLIAIYDKLLAMFRELDLEPNWFAAGDGQSRTQWRKFGGAFHQKVMESGGVGYQTVSLCVAPSGSKAPAYDNFAEVSFIFSPVGRQVDLTLVVHEPHLVAGTQRCETVIAELASLWSWDYGFGFARDSAKMPMGYVNGGISRTETPEELRSIEKWYAAYQPTERRERVRDIFHTTWLAQRIWPAHSPTVVVYTTSSMPILTAPFVL